MSDSNNTKTAADWGVGRGQDKNVADWTEDGIRVIVKTIRGSHYNVYLGVPSDHPAAGHSYNDVPVSCHGGLTYGAEGDEKYLPKGRYWYGYDYPTPVTK